MDHSLSCTQYHWGYEKTGVHRAQQTTKGCLYVCTTMAWLWCHLKSSLSRSSIMSICTSTSNQNFIFIGFLYPSLWLSSWSHLLSNVATALPPFWHCTYVCACRHIQLCNIKTHWLLYVHTTVLAHVQYIRTVHSIILVLKYCCTYVHTYL